MELKLHSYEFECSARSVCHHRGASSPQRSALHAASMSRFLDIDRVLSEEERVPSTFVHGAAGLACLDPTLYPLPADGALPEGMSLCADSMVTATDRHLYVHVLVCAQSPSSSPHPNPNLLIDIV